MRERAVSLARLTVFAPIATNASSDRILAVLFHRSAAVLYFIYAAWGIVSLIGVIPTIELSLGILFQDIFSISVVVVAAIACAGATFFPRTGRMEMFTSAMLTVLIGYYIYLLGEAAWSGEPGRWPAVVYGATHLVIPIARTAFVYLTLVRNARENQ